MRIEEKKRERTTLPRDVTTALVSKLSGHTGGVNSLALLQDGRLVSASADGAIKIWKAGKCKHTLTGHAADIKKLIELNNGNLATASSDGTIKIWKPKGTSFKCIDTVNHDQKQDFNTVYDVVELDQNKLVSTTMYADVNCWNLNVKVKKVVKKGLFRDKKITVFECAKIPVNHIINITKLEKGFLALSSKDKSIKIWDMEEKRCMHTLLGHTHVVCSSVYFPKANLLATASFDTTIKIWDLATGECKQTLEGHASPVLVVIKINNDNLVSASTDGTIKTWNLEDGQCIKTFKGYRNRINDLVELENGNLVAANDDGTIKIWDSKFLNNVSSNEKAIKDAMEYLTEEGALFIDIVRTFNSNPVDLKSVKQLAKQLVSKIKENTDHVTPVLGEIFVYSKHNMQALDYFIENCLEKAMEYKTKDTELFTNLLQVMHSMLDRVTKYWEQLVGLTELAVQDGAPEFYRVALEYNVKMFAQESNITQKWSSIFDKITTCLHMLNEQYEYRETAKPMLTNVYYEAESISALIYFAKVRCKALHTYGIEIVAGKLDFKKGSSRKKPQVLRGSVRQSIGRTFSGYGKASWYLTILKIRRLTNEIIYKKYKSKITALQKLIKAEGLSDWRSMYASQEALATILPQHYNCYSINDRKKLEDFKKQVLFGDGKNCPGFMDVVMTALNSNVNIRYLVGIIESVIALLENPIKQNDWIKKHLLIVVANIVSIVNKQKIKPISTVSVAIKRLNTVLKTIAKQARNRQEFFMLFKPHNHQSSMHDSLQVREENELKLAMHNSLNDREIKIQQVNSRVQANILQNVQNKVVPDNNADDKVSCEDEKKSQSKNSKESNKQSDVVLEHKQSINVRSSYSNSSRVSQYNSIQLFAENLVIQNSLKDYSNQGHQDSLREIANSYGFNCHDMKHDGNCFFQGVASQLNRIRYQGRSDYSASQVRAICIRHIQLNRRLYSESVSGEWNTFISSMSKDGEWVDHRMIVACSRAFNINVVIVRSDNRCPTITKRSNWRNVPSIYLGYEVGVHYQSLISNTNTENGNGIITTHLENAQVDPHTGNNVNVLQIDNQTRNSQMFFENYLLSFSDIGDTQTYVDGEMVYSDGRL